MKEAPLHRDTVALCGVLLDELGEEGYEALSRRMASSALDLLEDMTLAVAGLDRVARLEDADAGLEVFRTHLRLAHELGLLEEEVFLDLAEQADLVGRQMGGWLKRLRHGRE